MNANNSMKTLTIFYDPHCGMCTAFRGWLERQKKAVRVEFVDYAGNEARVTFPNIRELKADQDIVVLADDGRWWQGSSAWLVCLWTTFEYREWAFRFAGAHWQPLVKRFVHALSTRRHVISQLLGLKSERQMWQELNTMGDEVCHSGNCAIPTTMPPALPFLTKAKEQAQNVLTIENHNNQTNE